MISKHLRFSDLCTKPRVETLGLRLRLHTMALIYPPDGEKTTPHRLIAFPAVLTLKHMIDAPAYLNPRYRLEAYATLRRGAVAEGPWSA